MSEFGEVRARIEAAREPASLLLGSVVEAEDRRANVFWPMSAALLAILDMPERDRWSIVGDIFIGHADGWNECVRAVHDLISEAFKHE